MVTRVNTGVPVAGGPVNAPGDERQSQNTLFSVLSTSALSHKFSVDESPVYLKAFGLTGFVNVQVIMVTNTSAGELNEPLNINGQVVMLSPVSNFIILDLPGEYRLQLSDTGALGVVTVVSGITAMSYGSWGLKAYGCCGVVSGEGGS